MITQEEPHLDSGGLGIGAVIEPDGVAHLMSQQGTPLLCHAVRHLPEGRTYRQTRQETHVSVKCFIYFPHCRQGPQRGGGRGQNMVHQSGAVKQKRDQREKKGMVEKLPKSDSF